MSKLMDSVYCFFFITLAVGEGLSVSSGSGSDTECDELCHQVCPEKEDNHRISKIQGDDASGFSSWASDDEECDLCLTSCLYDGDLETPKPRAPIETATIPPVTRGLRNLFTAPIETATIPPVTSPCEQAEVRNDTNQIVVIGIIGAVVGLLVGLVLGALIGIAFYNRHVRKSCTANNLKSNSHELEEDEHVYQGLHTNIQETSFNVKDKDKEYLNEPLYSNSVMYSAANHHTP